MTNHGEQGSGGQPPFAGQAPRWLRDEPGVPPTAGMPVYGSPPPYPVPHHPVPQPQGYGMPDQQGQPPHGYPPAYSTPYPHGQQPHAYPSTQSSYPPPTYPMGGPPLSDHSKVVAGFLQFFFGWLGVGRFYIGDARTGGIKIGLCIFGFFTLLFGIGLVVWLGLSLWCLIDAILMWSGSVRDGQGRPLR